MEFGTQLVVKPGTRVRISKYDPAHVDRDLFGKPGGDGIKRRAEELLAKSLEELSMAQERLYADDRYSVLIVLQAMDTAGKDGLIRHVMSGINPQGCQVFAFKQPSAEELDHDFLWRAAKCLPERGRIGVFNRSYYEEVLVVKVHQEWLDRQRLPTRQYDKDFWRSRYEDINTFERHLVQNGTIVLKFFLNISKAEQAKRLLARLKDPTKQWKFAMGDLDERALWSKYMDAYGDALSATSTEWAPWYIVPANHKWAARATVSAIIASTLQSLDLRYPALSARARQDLATARKALAHK